MTTESWDTAEATMRRVSSLPVLSTGSKAIDGLLGGGCRAGSLTQIFGSSNSGKTQLAMQTVLLAARAGTRSLFIDTEGSFRPERVVGIAEARGWESSGLLERIVYVRSDSASEQMETIRKMAGRATTSPAGLVVVDTLTRNFSVELPGNKNLASRQAALDVHISEMARDAYLHGRAYLLTNRVTFGATGDVGIGGRTVEQLVGASVMLERHLGKVKATLLPGGATVLAELGVAGVA
jgi:DNA repair protein RadA